MTLFVFLFSQENIDFRIAELRGICAVFDIKFDFSQINTQEHIFVVEFPDEVPVRLILSRSILLKSAYFYMFDAETYDEMHANIKSNLDVFEKFNRADESFSIRVRPVGRKKGIDCMEIPKVFGDYLPLKAAPVNLEKPVNAFTILEVYKCSHERPTRVYFTRLLGYGQSRLKTQYSLKDRCYIGNTTMDPELSFIQANIAAIKAGNLVLDPFVGTGGLLLSAAQFGAYVVGTEINYQIAKGLGKSSRHDVKYRSEKESLSTNFVQYGTSHLFLCALIADASWHRMWHRPVFDSIISDPPYGLREKSRRVLNNAPKNNCNTHIAENYIHFPEKQPYSLDASFNDLCDLAAKILIVGGRMSFWFPVILESYSPKCLPTHPALELIENCEQILTRKTSRRLLTYRKVREPYGEERSTTLDNQFESRSFREVLLHPKLPQS